ncbi:hypothetical protein THRCLA_20066 [Thraustotheca clavata]|uniref:Uncharacterized protein n=1 Tax=Thraustotheca clavata TaxID=74557 RepID=A0A1W0ABV5_9STRA|nr:hypothetical protein THRCLA_20066 [Thraustotheca clavata]
MDMLRLKLAEASAYDNVPMDKANARKAKVKRPPNLVKAVPSTILLDNERMSKSIRLFGARKKPLSAIQEGVEKLNRFEPQYLPQKPSKGIEKAAKDVLQDAYNTRPREISTIPTAFDKQDNNAKIAGKRHGPASISQVFLM